jgi:hypothetical protein
LFLVKNCFYITLFKAGVITATLYELFQAVFKLRQEAAQQKRAQVNAQASPTAIAVPVSNGMVQFLHTYYVLL